MRIVWLYMILICSHSPCIFLLKLKPSNHNAETFLWDSTADIILETNTMHQALCESQYRELYWHGTRTLRSDKNYAIVCYWVLDLTLALSRGNLGVVADRFLRPNCMSAEWDPAFGLVCCACTCQIDTV